MKINLSCVLFIQYQLAYFTFVLLCGFSYQTSCFMPWEKLCKNQDRVQNDQFWHFGTLNWHFSGLHGILMWLNTCKVESQRDWADTFNSDNPYNQIFMLLIFSRCGKIIKWWEEKHSLYELNYQRHMILDFMQLSTPFMMIMTSC